MEMHAMPTMPLSQQLAFTAIIVARLNVC